MAPLPISKTTHWNQTKLDEILCFVAVVGQNISEIFTNFDHKLSHHALCMAAARCQLMENIYLLQLKSQLPDSPKFWQLILKILIQSL